MDSSRQYFLINLIEKGALLTDHLKGLSYRIHLAERVTFRQAAQMAKGNIVYDFRIIPALRRCMSGELPEIIAIPCDHLPDQEGYLNLINRIWFLPPRVAWDMDEWSLSYEIAVKERHS